MKFAFGLILNSRSQPEVCALICFQSKSQFKRSMWFNTKLHSLYS